LPQPSFFILTHLGCSGNHTTLLISLLFYIVFFNHATLDISALSITHTHIIIIIIFLITQPRGSQSWVIFHRENRI
jgi:hypothetical protein